MKNSNGMSDGTDDMSEFGTKKVGKVSSAHPVSKDGGKVDQVFLGELKIYATDWERNDLKQEGKHLLVCFGGFAVRLAMPNDGDHDVQGVVIEIESRRSKKKDWEALKLEITEARNGLALALISEDGISVGPRTFQGWEKLEDLKVNAS